eukprot:1080822-Amphidinium_carterae.1
MAPVSPVFPFRVSGLIPPHFKAASVAEDRDQLRASGSVPLVVQPRLMEGNLMQQGQEVKDDLTHSLLQVALVLVGLRGGRPNFGLRQCRTSLLCAPWAFGFSNDHTAR